METIFYRDQKFRIHSEVYKPDEDTYLLADNLEVGEGERVLELGTGCGLVSILAAKKGADVVSTDINKKALECARENAEAHEVESKIQFKEGDLFTPISGEKFDKIIFNPPYLPVPSNESLESNLEIAWNGGPDGRDVIDEFLDKVLDYLTDTGCFLIVQSSLSGVQDTLDRLDRVKFSVDVETKKLFFEDLYLFRVNVSG